MAESEWREMFSEQVRLELEHHREILEEIKGLLAKQNSRIRENEVAIAGLRVWVPMVGGIVAIASIVASALVQVLVR